MNQHKNILNLANFEFKPSRKVWNGIDDKLNQQEIPCSTENEYLENFELQPSGKVWNKLNTHLENTDLGTSSLKLSFYKYAFFSAVAVIVLLSTFIFLDNNNSSKTLLNHQNTEQTKSGLLIGLEGRTFDEVSIRANEGTLSSDIIVVSDTDSKTSLALTSSMHSTKKAENKNDNPTQDKLFRSWNKNLEPENTQGGRIREKMKESGLILGVKSNVNKEEINYFHSINNEMETLFTPSFSFLENEKNNEYNFEKTNSTQNASNSTLAVGEEKTDKTAKVKQSSLNNNEQNRINFDQINEIVYNEQDQIELIPTILFQNNIDIWKNISLVERENNFTTNFKDNRTNIYPKIKTFSLTYEIGKWKNTAENNIEIRQQIMQQLSVQRWWELNKYFSFGTGISRVVYSSSQNQTLTFNFDGNTYDDVQISSALANNKIRAFLPQAIGVGAGSSIDYDITTNEKAVYYAIPLNLQIGINFGKLNLHTQLGINTAYLVNYNINLPTTEQRLDRVEIQHSTINKFNMFGNSKLGLGYNISNKTNVQIHGVFSKSMLNTNNSFTNKPNAFGGGISILYSL